MRDFAPDPFQISKYLTRTSLQLFHHCSVGTAPLKIIFSYKFMGKINVNVFLTKIGEISSICFILSLLLKQTYNFHIFPWDTQIL